jgi:hypothetical protein
MPALWFRGSISGRSHPSPMQRRDQFGHGARCVAQQQDYTSTVVCCAVCSMKHCCGDPARALLLGVWAGGGAASARSAHLVHCIAVCWCGVWLGPAAAAAWLREVLHLENSGAWLLHQLA